jgi:hypothetical protein
MARYLFLLIGAIFCIFTIPASAYAANGRVISGPNGSATNGWYSARPTFTVDTNPTCPNGVHTFTVGNHKGEGLHHITVRTYLSDHPSIDYLDGKDGTEINAETWYCPSLSSSYDGQDPTKIWEGDIRWDGIAPTVTITAPKTNTNTSSSKLNVAGTVSDSTSGVGKLVVNGVAASIAGNAFSVSIPLGVGLNTITAEATDLAANTSKSNEIVVNRLNSSEGGTAKPQTPRSKEPAANAAGSTNASIADDTGIAESKQEGAKALNGGLVKSVAKAGGISLAAVLGVIVAVLLLDKYGIIEVRIAPKLTSAVSSRFKKSNRG